MGNIVVTLSLGLRHVPWVSVECSWQGPRTVCVCACVCSIALGLFGKISPNLCPKVAQCRLLGFPFPQWLPLSGISLTFPAPQTSSSLHLSIPAPEAAVLYWGFLSVSLGAPGGRGPEAQDSTPLTHSPSSGACAACPGACCRPCSRSSVFVVSSFLV